MSFPSLSLTLRFAIASFVVLLCMGATIAYELGQAVEGSAIVTAKQTAQDTLQRHLIGHLRLADLTLPMTDGRLVEYHRFVAQNVLSDRTVRIKLWNAQGRVMYSNESRLMGRSFSLNSDLIAALQGQSTAAVSNLVSPEDRGDRRYHQLLETYLPVRLSKHGKVLGAFEVSQLYAPIASQVAAVRHTVYLLLASGLVMLYLLLFGIVQRGSRTIRRQQRQLARYTDDLAHSYRQTITSLAAAVDARDSSTERHSARVTELATALGRWLKLSDAELEALEHGALLHDVGKIGISDQILLKPSRLTEQERLVMRQHPDIGHSMLQDVTFLEHALPLIRHHHERWDGTGYPDHLQGKLIPFAARLFAVVDAYDALTSDRPYRLGISHQAALEILRSDAGTHFDPLLVDSFAVMLSETVELQPVTKLHRRLAVGG